METASLVRKLTEDTGALTIGPHALTRVLASGRRVLVVDVRESTEAELSAWHFPGAVHVPLHQLFVRRDDLPLGGAEMVVAVSNRGVRARAAAFTLSLLGASDVRVLEGGLEAWARRRLPTA